MAPFRFDRFELDLADRRLTRDGEAVALNARYFDALALLVREQGKLVTKQRFLDEVWRGVPVTDEALTQCVRTLRKLLNDDAGAPRLIQTVPKHGYRFIAPMDGQSPPDRPASDWPRVLRLGLAGTGGAVTAGAIGGLAYGFAAGTGVSALAVLLSVTLLVALLGGAGVAFGVALAEFAPGRPWWRAPFGGAIGGLGVGAVVKLVGLDAFALLLGHAPDGITGGGEGVLLGGAVGLAFWLAGKTSGARQAAVAAAVGGAAGLVIPLLGGRLLGGSLDLLAHSFPDSRLKLTTIGGLFGEPGLGPLSQAVTGALEGALFAAGLVGAMLWAQRRHV
ncbi:MAG: winged helix-turn-helix domain-containing protein [Caulobacter sp.]|nr:winged helix-turn-helix domain-containing protein [Caulobacter sp.]